MGYAFKVYNGKSSYTGSTGTTDLIAPTSGQIFLMKSCKIKWDNNLTGTAPTWTATFRTNDGSNTLTLDSFSFTNSGSGDETVEYCWNQTGTAGEFLNLNNVAFEYGDKLQIDWGFAPGSVTGSVDVTYWITGVLYS